MKNKQNFNGRAFSRNFVSSRYFCKNRSKRGHFFSLVSDLKKKQKKIHIYTEKFAAPYLPSHEKLQIMIMTKNHFSAPKLNFRKSSNCDEKSVKEKNSRYFFVKCNDAFVNKH